jgi:hypothetical protein
LFETAHIFFFLISNLPKKLLLISIKKAFNYFHYRATNGNKTVGSETQVIANEDVVFNDTYTGVVQNDSNVIKLSCMATGKPKPELSLRLYSDYGPSLINAGEYKVCEKYDIR